MELEYYSHQQQQQHQQNQKQQQQQLQQKKKQQQQISVQYQVDPENSMAATNINSTTTGNNSNNSTNNNHISSSSSNSNNITTSTTLTTSTADAATVAIAKDMLQLHHGGALNNNNNVTDATHAHSPTNNVQTTGAATPTTASAPSPVSNHQQHQNPPPAHIAAAGVITTGFGATASTLAPAPPTPPDNALGQLRFNQDVLYITEPITVIGRNSSTSLVHFHVAENNLVSRKHFQVLYDGETHDFYVQCLSKNGIFVDDFLQRRNADPLKLPARCFFRFPSTEIRIQFESFLPTQQQHHTGNSLITVSDNNQSASIPGNAHVIIAPVAPDDVHLQQSHQHLQHHTQQQTGHVPIHSQPQPPQQQQQHHHHSLHPHQSHLPQQQQQRSSTGPPASGPAPPSTAGAHLLPMEGGNAIYSPLKISIPKKGQKSPYLSPTGTISAANSCPASPRQGFHQVQANYNNYSNNNLQNQDLFQTPSTATYNHNEKPPYSYAQLIVQAISAAPDKQLTLSGIYSFIVKHYPYYRKETNKGWQNSIRHNLSLNRYFIKVARSQDEPGKGSFWRIDPDSGAKLIDHSYKKRRQRSSQGFRPPYGMPRSAPVSPSHMDNSRESSPLQDIVLQSAPGSPGISLENRATESDIIYNSQNAHGQAIANNSHNQYSSGSPYYVTNQNSGAVQQPHVDSSGPGINNGGSSGGSNGGNSVGALIALKRNHVMAAGAANLARQQQQQQQQALHPDVIYDEMPTDYSGHMESGDDEGVDTKRSKYENVSEVL